MAHLLGHRGCMESLRADLRDLQAAIADVCSRAGTVRFPSWKFPDKMSCDLDIAVLLQRYRHSDSEPEFSQHAHVVLLELLIDRLLLLLQSFTGYAETVLSGRAVPPARGPGRCMSAGLTARTFWSTMLKLGAFCQQLRDEKDSRGEIPTQQSTPPSAAQAGKYQKEHQKCLLPDGLESGTAPEAAQSTWVCPCASGHVLGSSGSSQPRAGPSRAQSTHSVPTQTPGSPLGSCDTCSSTQASLQEVSRAITSICQSHNIPSAASKFQEVLEGSTGRRSLSATDMSYWASEQSKDLSRINKHLQGLLQQVNPVKAELEEMCKQKEKLQKQVEDFSRKLQAQKNIQAEQQRKAEQSLQAKDKEYSKTVARLERDKEDLRRGAALQEERLSALKEELAAKQVAVQELELSKTTLLEEMRTTMVAQSQVLELEEKVQVLTGQRDRLEQELSATSMQLEKERVRVQSMFRHEESLQAKQRTLLQQLDSLDQEREELQASLGEAEEGRARLAEQLEQSGKQLQAQQELLDTLQQEKLALEQSILELQANTSRLEEQAQELRERERLLVFFPDLHNPPEMQFESSGNLTEDMESQLQANNIRIKVLEQENTQLEALLAKVKAAAEQGVLKLIPQAQLGSQLHRESSRQDSGWLSSGSSRDSTGMPGCTDRAWHGGPSSQHSKQLRAEPTLRAKPCLTLPVQRLGAWPPLTPHRGSPQINTDHSEFPNRETVFHQQPPALPRGPCYQFFVHHEGLFPQETRALPGSSESCSRDVPECWSSVTRRALRLRPGHSVC